MISKKEYIYVYFITIFFFETDSLGLDSKKSKMAVFSLSVNDKYVFDVEPK